MLFLTIIVCLVISIYHSESFSAPVALSDKVIDVAFFHKDDLSSATIKCVLSDMDGTLMLPQHGVSSRTVSAVKSVIDKGIHFFPATGRTRMNMASAVGDDLIKLLGGDVSKIPGVYSQGLIVYGLTGEKIHE